MNAPDDDGTRSPDPDEDHRIRLCRKLVKARVRVGNRLGFDLCPAPAWDILLDLYIAAHEARPVQIWSLCIAANIPTSTAHRKISEMVKNGVLLRGNLGGRVIVSLSSEIKARLDVLLDELAKLF